MDRNDVIDLLTIVQVGDNRTIGEPDIGFWLGLLGPFEKDDCCAAIEAHRRDQPGVWIEPGHVVGRVRAARRDRLDRMDVEQRRLAAIGSFDRVEDRREKTGLNVISAQTSTPVESSRVGEALPRGTYIEADPAGWVYGIPRNTMAWDAEPNEKDNLRIELDARIRVYRDKNPECVSNAEAEHAIRLKDRERADAALRKLKRGGLADVLGGAFPAGSEDGSVLDAEVVTLEDQPTDEELF